MILLAAILLFLGCFALLWLAFGPGDEEWFLEDDHYDSPLWRIRK